MAKMREKMRRLLVQPGDEPLTTTSQVVLVLGTLCWTLGIALVVHGVAQGQFVSAVVFVLLYTLFTTWFIWNLTEAPEMLRDEQLERTTGKRLAAFRRVAWVMMVSSLLFPLMLLIGLRDQETY